MLERQGRSVAKDASFARQDASKWHDEVPGARWFKADLHTHTLDDLAGGRAKVPSGVSAPPASEEAVAAYARQFLRSAAERQIRVLGVTPHSPRLAQDVSVVWRIVDEWNVGADDDGEPFRNKIYAVFPGFEPALNDGRSGLHLLFLFDPEIGQHNYLKAFDLAMGGRSPWENGDLQVSAKSSSDVFKEIREFHSHESIDARGWDYIVLAPHIDNDKGLLGALKSQSLAMFEHREIAALELGDNKLPEDTLHNRDWLGAGMAARRQAFFHGSDAYAVADLGQRYTWMKLAKPRIEALRQAFIASDSRIRLAYRRDAGGELAEISDAPDVTLYQRPWLKSVTVAGGASFFGGGGGTGTTCFRFNPDLTCIIGGSMTGKSTLLDGLRVHAGAPPPVDPQLRKQVQARGQSGFLGGSPDVSLECPGRDPSDMIGNQWPAVHYTQNELQRLSQQSGTVEEILARLVAVEAEGVQERERRIVALDRTIADFARTLATLDDDVAVAEQARSRALNAADELAAIANAGVDDLHRAAGRTQHWRETEGHFRELAAGLDQLLDAAGAVDTPWDDEQLGDSPSLVVRTTAPEHWRRVCDLLQDAKGELNSAWLSAKEATQTLADRERSIRQDVDRRLAELGLDRARIDEFQALSRQAALLPSYQAALDGAATAHATAERAFRESCHSRRMLIDEQRQAFDRVIEAIGRQFDGRVLVRRIDEGNREPLWNFIKDLAQRGITRWWNDLPDESRPGSGELLAALDTDRLSDIGMSPAVDATVRQCLTQALRRELAVIRCRDRYVLDVKLDDGVKRSLDALSGGQRVSVLLSLLLETHDKRPLVIDQPEDELDNRFLFETVLPALKRLKGRRQIIVATHNANIVVNGDADQVIQLEATASRGRIAAAGVIDETVMRDAIVKTVDGGDEAFRLRRLKYGF